MHVCFMRLCISSWNPSCEHVSMCIFIYIPLTYKYLYTQIFTQTHTLRTRVYLFYVYIYDDFAFEWLHIPAYIHTCMSTNLHSRDIAFRRFLYRIPPYFACEVCNVQIYTHVSTLYLNRRPVRVSASDPTFVYVACFHIDVFCTCRSVWI